MKELDIIADTVTDYIATKAAIAKLTAHSKSLKAEIDQVLGDDAEGGTIAGKQVLIVDVAKKRALSQSILRETFPEAYENSMEFSEVRSLKIPRY